MKRPTVRCVSRRSARVRWENEVLIGRRRAEAGVGGCFQRAALVARSSGVAHFRKGVFARNPQLGHGICEFPISGLDHGTCSGETPRVVVSRCDERDVGGERG